MPPLKIASLIIPGEGDYSTVVYADGMVETRFFDLDGGSRIVSRWNVMNYTEVDYIDDMIQHGYTNN